MLRPSVMLRAKALESLFQTAEMVIARITRLKVAVRKSSHHVPFRQTLEHNLASLVVFHADTFESIAAVRRSRVLDLHRNIRMPLADEDRAQKKRQEYSRLFVNHIVAGHAMSRRCGATFVINPLRVCKGKVWRICRLLSVFLRHTVTATVINLIVT